MQDNNLWHLSDNSDYSLLYEEVVYTVKDNFAITIFQHHTELKREYFTNTVTEH